MSVFICLIQFLLTPKRTETRILQRPDGYVVLVRLNVAELVPGERVVLVLGVLAVAGEVKLQKYARQCS